MPATTPILKREPPGPAPAAARRRLAPLSDFWNLIRPRIVAMVLFTMVVATLVAGPELPPWHVAVNALVGSALVIAGAVALNQRLEHRSDAKMLRTAKRPLPSGRLTVAQATWFGVLASLAGLIYLALTVQLIVVALTFFSWIIYVWMYTPVKMLSAWQTPLGALAGAMPILMGAAAASAPWSATSLTLFGILYFWQFPHAMAIAWLYREDFAAAGLRVASVIDPSGRLAGILSVAGAILLLPVSLLPASPLGSRVGWATWGYAMAASVLGLGYLGCSVVFARQPGDRTARTLLRISLVYLPAVCVALLAAALI